MAKVSIYGIEETAAMLKELQKQSEPIIKAGIYDGASSEKSDCRNPNRRTFVL